MAFFEDIYLYDLNVPDAAPLAYRSARGGEAQPTLLSLLGLSAREWGEIAPRLYDCSVYIGKAGGAVLLPVMGAVGCYALVVKTSLSASAFACLSMYAGQAATYVHNSVADAVPRVGAAEQEAVESARCTVAELQLLMRDCANAQDACAAMQCVEKAAALMGVTLMSPETAELTAMHASGFLPSMQMSGQVLLVCALTLLSLMRNAAHARSGWLYAVQEESGYTLQVLFRCAEDTDLSALTALREALMDAGVSLGALTRVVPVKPPKQYAYLHRKIIDPRKPLCARCGCLDTRCATCTVTRWAVLPYVCDAALLGIKALPYFTSDPDFE